MNRIVSQGRIGLALIAMVASGMANAAPPTPVQLANSNWKIIRIDGKSPASSQASLRFEGERIRATAGCNTLSGGWNVNAGRLDGGPFMATMMYCQSVTGDNSLMAQERALADLLAAKPSLELKRNRLILRSLGHSAELQRQP